MSRESRLNALRARRAAGIYSTIPDAAEAPGAYDPSLGLPAAVIRESPPPIPVPEGLRGVYQRCGNCTSYMASDSCEYCARYAVRR